MRTTTRPGAYRTLAGSVVWAEGDQSDDLDFAEAELKLPPPPRLPTLLGLPRPLHTPSSMPAVTETIAPRRAA